MKITKARLAELVREVVQEEKTEYEKFFRGMLKKHGVSSPAELSDEEKKKFFNQVDAQYKAKHEGNEFGAERAKAIAKGDDSFKVGDKEFPVTNVDDEDKKNAEKFANESNDCGCNSVNEGFYKNIMSDGGRNLFFAMVDDKTDEVKTIDAKTWLKSSLQDNASKHSKERIVKAILRNQKQFNKKVDFNMWAKKNKPNFKETMEYFFKNGFINNITNKGIKVYESVEEAVFEGRAFVAAAKKAKEEGKTEFEFNGKKYPVTLKD